MNIKFVVYCGYFRGCQKTEAAGDRD